MHAYERVAEELADDIVAGRYPAGTALPVIPELEQRFGVSRITVRGGLDELARRGLVYTGYVDGRRGTIVRRWEPLRWRMTDWERRHQSAGEVDAWSSDVIEQGREPHQEVTVSLVTAPDRVRELLQLDDDATAVLRSRVRSVDGRPWQLSDSYFAEELARGTPLMSPHDVSAKGGILASIGHPQARLSEEIAIRMPRSDEATRLEIDPGTPVAEITRTGYDADDRPLRVMITIAPGDRHVLVYEFDA